MSLHMLVDSRRRSATVRGKFFNQRAPDNSMMQKMFSYIGHVSFILKNCLKSNSVSKYIMELEVN